MPIPSQLTVPNIAATAPAAFKPPVPRLIVKSLTPQARVDENLPEEIARGTEKKDLNFNFSVAGKSDNIMPLKVYDDGKKTYFQFSNDNLIIPSINLVDVYGGERALTYAIHDGFVEVPTLGRQFTLRLADSLICIYNNKMLQVKR